MTVQFPKGVVLAILQKYDAMRPVLSIPTLAQSHCLTNNDLKSDMVIHVGDRHVCIWSGTTPVPSQGAGPKRVPIWGHLYLCLHPLT